MNAKLAYRNLPQLFLRAREELLRHFRPLITHFGLTEQQWRILRTISEMEQLEPREICEICQILSPSLTGVLSRMEDMDLVTRTRMVEELGPLIVEQYKIIEQAFGPELIQELYDVMDKVIQAERAPIPQVKLPKRKSIK